MSSTKLLSVIEIFKILYKCILQLVRILSGGLESSFTTLDCMYRSEMLD
jgi:hypothetical protein